MIMSGPWTETEKQRLREMAVSGVGEREMSRRLGRSVGAIGEMRRQLGIQRAGRMIRGRYKIKTTTRFDVGDDMECERIPWFDLVDAYLDAVAAERAAVNGCGSAARLRVRAALDRVMEHGGESCSSSHGASTRS